MFQIQVGDFSEQGWQEVKGERKQMLLTRDAFKLVTLDWIGRNMEFVHRLRKGIEISS